MCGDKGRTAARKAFVIQAYILLSVDVGFSMSVSLACVLVYFVKMAASLETDVAREGEGGREEKGDGRCGGQRLKKRRGREKKRKIFVSFVPFLFSFFFLF